MQRFLSILLHRKNMTGRYVVVVVVVVVAFILHREPNGHMMSTSTLHYCAGC